MLVQYLTKKTSFFEQDAEFVLAVWDLKKEKFYFFIDCSKYFLNLRRNLL